VRHSTPDKYLVACWEMSGPLWVRDGTASLFVGFLGSGTFFSIFKNFEFWRRVKQTAGKRLFSPESTQTD